jgi:type VI protein secretion system component Hcp
LRRGTALALVGVTLVGALLLGAGVGAQPAPTSFSPPPGQLPESLDYRMTVVGGVLGTKSVTVDIESWAFDMETPTVVGGSAGTGLSSGKTALLPIVVSMQYEKSLTIPLARQEVSGGHLTSVTIEGYALDYESSDTYVHIVLSLTNVVVTAYSIGASSGELPEVEVTFQYAKIEMNGGPDYKGTALSWDQTKNKA